MNYQQRSNVNYIINDETGSFWYRRDFYKDTGLFQWMLSQSIPKNPEDDSAFWKMKTGKIFQNEYIIPRLLRQMSDHNDAITYGGKKHTTYRWNRSLHQLRILLMKRFNVFLDFCLLNYYRDGNDKIDPHPDRESLGSKNITIGVSFGASRKFVIHRAVGGKNSNSVKSSEIDQREYRHSDYTYKYCKDRQKYGDICHVEFDNVHGDLYCMENAFHFNYVHSVPEKRGYNEPRISLTFRQVRDDNFYKRMGLDPSNIPMMLEYLQRTEQNYLEDPEYDTSPNIPFRKKKKLVKIRKDVELRKIVIEEDGRILTKVRIESMKE
jgi:alkylated DNA repair dioxygenase AlkB